MFFRDADFPSNFRDVFHGCLRGRNSIASASSPQPPMPPAPLELPGLRVELDKLVYRHGGGELPPDRPHAFIYYLTVHNESQRTVTLLGRKWLVENSDGTRLVIEGDGIVGQTPRLEPGEHFSYNSYHITAQDAQVHGSFHGVDEQGARVFVRIPRFALEIPPE
jgi:ApaG protein